MAPDLSQMTFKASFHLYQGVREYVDEQSCMSQKKAYFSLHKLE